jgi:hypothetical protein
MIGKRIRRGWLLAGVGFAATIGLIAFGVSLGAVGDEDVQVYPEEKEFIDPAERPEPTKLPRPDEKLAVSIQSAIAQLRSSAPMESLLDSARLGDSEALLELSDQGNFCERRFREPQPQCSGREEYPGFYVQAALPQPVLMPEDLVERYLKAILSNKPIQLTLVAKDSGQEGRYYLVFKASKPVALDGSDYDSVGFVVQPNAAKPVKWIRFILPTNNGLEWLQIIAGENSSTRFDLVAPESIKDWPGLWGQKGD